MKLSNREKAELTYKAMRAMTNSKADQAKEVAKLAKNKDKEVSEYHQDKVNKMRRRKL